MADDVLVDGGRDEEELSPLEITSISSSNCTAGNVSAELSSFLAFSVSMEVAR